MKYPLSELKKNPKVERFGSNNETIAQANTYFKQVDQTYNLEKGKKTGEFWKK